MSIERGAIRVRLAGPQDTPELARILGIFDNIPLNPAHLDERLRATKDLETPFVAEADGQVIGMACLRQVPSLSSDYPYAEISELYIEKGFQGQDIEQALIAAIETHASLHGARRLTLLTGLKNIDAQTLYRGQGYRDYALAMQKHLKHTDPHSKS